MNHIVDTKAIPKFFLLYSTDSAVLANWLGMKRCLGFFSSAVATRDCLFRHSSGADGPPRSLAPIY